MSRKTFAHLALSATLFLAGALPAAQSHPWDDPALSPEKRAALVVAQMTEAEKRQLLFGYFASLTTNGGPPYEPPASAIMGSAGYVPGIERLGITSLWEADAGLGVATQGGSRDKMREGTSLPSGIATAATWNPALAEIGGAMIGDEARRSGFNVMLAGGVNLLREPRNGRNFEYGGEDPLLAGMIVGAEIRGIQSNHIISTLKHFAVNDQETGRFFADARLADDQARLSDLLAFEISLEQGDPGSVMCSYNLVNGDHACENDHLLNQVLRRDWGFKGFVMSDWGAVHSTVKAINAGLDQQSGAQFDDQPYFAEPLRQALQAGTVTKARLDSMAGRILYAMFKTGVIDHKVGVAPIDYDGHGLVSRSDAEEAIVLLKNDHAVLPLGSDLRKIAVIGGHADRGVMAGGGSSLVYPIGGNAVPGIAPTTWPGPVMFHPSSPLVALRQRLPQTELAFDDGTDLAAAERLAASADLALVFVTQWAGEDFDVDLTLPNNQDALVTAVATAARKTIVVVESGGPILMPWRDQVSAILESWYPGTSGGEAIARVLTGEVDASGRLPVTFPKSLAQLPRPALDRPSGPAGTRFEIDYFEGATVGYKWFDAKHLEPLFPFGHGLSYSRYSHDGLTASVRNNRVTVSFTVKNIGERSGKDVPQIYVGPAAGGWEAPRRLAGWTKIDLKPGESQAVTLSIDPRLLALYDSGSWKIVGGDYSVWLGSSSRDLPSKVAVTLRPELIKK